MERSAKDRLIVALDVPTVDDALAIVQDLGDSVSFYKIGLELLMSGRMFEVVERIGATDVFLDLKLPADIPTTVRRTVNACVGHKAIKFLTLSAAGATSLTLDVIAAAKEGRGTSEYPKLLTVPFLSSLDRSDLVAMFGEEAEPFETFLLKRSEAFVNAGSDGLIISGKEIELLRQRFERGKVTLVSPGIRPSGASVDDHKRSTTPSQAIAMGADYLVVGRPIVGQPTPGGRRKVADEIVAEIEKATNASRSKGGGSGGSSMIGYETQSLAAKPLD